MMLFAAACEADRTHELLRIDVAGAPSRAAQNETSLHTSGIATQVV